MRHRRLNLPANPPPDEPQPFPSTLTLGQAIAMLDENAPALVLSRARYAANEADRPADWMTVMVSVSSLDIESEDRRQGSHPGP